MRAAAILLLGALAASPGAHAADNGIFVGEPKLYDDYTLEQMLLEAEQSLGELELNKADAISSALGSRQGARSTQTQFSLTASQRPIPSIDVTESATPSTVTKTPSVTPSPGNLPNLTAPTLPSDFDLSASDRLDELLQLKLRVSNLRLLLRGSLTDQVVTIGDDVEPLSRFTFGFPISIATPANWRYRDAVAEVLVTVEVDENCAPGGRPGLKMVLPQEKTYNVAQLKSSSTGIGTGVIAGAFSVGGNWLRGQSQHFLVQDQDTLAFQESGENGRQIVLGWRFKPVLGQRKVQPNLQQVFAQLTFPAPPGARALGKARVVTRWRYYERKTGALGDVITGTPSATQEFALERIDLAPGPVLIEFLDLGNGKVRASLKPEVTFFEGTTFRLGGGSPREVPRQTDHLELDVAPLDIVRQGILLGVRGEKERALVNACTDLGEPLPVPNGCETTPSVVRAVKRIADMVGNAKARGHGPCDDLFHGFKIDDVEEESLGQSTTRLKLKLDKLAPPGVKGLPFLTILGNKVFGLGDAPYDAYDDKKGIIELTVDNATLEKADAVEVVRLLWGPGYHASYSLNRVPKLVIGKSTVLSESGGLTLLLEGQGLDKAKIVFPDGAKIVAQIAGYAQVFVPSAVRADLKQLVLQGGAGNLVLVDVSKSSPPPAKPELNPPDPVKIGTGVKVPITWKNGGEIEAVTHSSQAQTLLDPAKNSVVVQLEDALTARPGKVALSVKFKDGTELPLVLQIVDQQVAVIQ
ncbi:MAG TPA: hypothetical protein VGS22_05400 [Thermoanaerobaculia bacterium]|jgi:hypothetical protein|nr:hypothetical protein [Thermoanaerobaculia bacterium]